MLQRMHEYGRRMLVAILTSFGLAHDNVVGRSIHAVLYSFVIFLPVCKGLKSRPTPHAPSLITFSLFAKASRSFGAVVRFTIAISVGRAANMR